MTGINETLEAWANITLNIFYASMDEYGWGSDPGHLRDSLRYFVDMQANGDKGKINFFFNQYGRYVDAGVGKEYHIGNSGDVIGIMAQREAKPWFYTQWWREEQRLKEILGEKYKDLAVVTTIEALHTIFGKDLENTELVSFSNKK